jgi:predicted alpha/beta hydrolase
MVAYDFPALFRTVAGAFPSAPHYLLGHSLGGQLGMLYLSQQPHMAKGAILVGAPSCHYGGWPFPKSLGMLAGIHLAVGIASVLGYFPGRRIGALGNNSTQTMCDMAAQVRTGRYQVPSSDVNFEPLLSKVDLPVLAVAIEGDNLAPRRGIQAFCKKLTSAQVTHWDLVLDASAHRNRHYSWVHANASLVDRVRAFVSSHR